MNSIIQSLKSLGLTETEAKIYLALIRTGSAPAGLIIKRTRLHRATVYDVLDRLCEKGLANFVIKNNRKYYEAAPSDRFLRHIKEEKMKLERKTKIAEKLLRELNRIKPLEEQKTIARIYLGKKGLKFLMDDIIACNENFLVLGAGGKFEDTMKYYTKEWARIRKKKNIRAKLIYTRGSKTAKWKLNEIRYLPKNYTSPATTFIYGNKVAIVLSQEEPMVIVLIESEKVAESYRNYFDILWNIAKR